MLPKVFISRPLPSTVTLWRLFTVWVCRQAILSWDDSTHSCFVRLRSMSVLWAAYYTTEGTRSNVSGTHGTFLWNKKERRGMDWLSGYVVDPTDTHFLSFYFAVCHRKWRCGSGKNPMLSPQGLSNKCHPSFEAAIVELNIFQQLKHISFWDLKGHTNLFWKTQY